MTKSNSIFAYFGGEPIGAPILGTLLEAGLKPSLVVTNPDRPVGRKQVLTPPPVKVLANEHNIPVIQPEDISDPSTIAELTDTAFDIFVVVAYNHILPKWLIDTPKNGSLNVHPSLLPKFRGPSPIRSAILTNTRTTGVSIMLLDEKMDHGPILAQETLAIGDTEWPLPGLELDRRLATLGGQLLADTIPKYLAGTITPQEQNHDEATYTKKFSRADGELTLDPHNLPTGDDAYQALLKVRAFDGFPGTFFMHDGKRVKINEAELTPEGQLRLVSVTPEGRRSMSFHDYLASL